MELNSAIKTENENKKTNVRFDAREYEVKIEKMTLTFRERK